MREPRDRLRHRHSLPINNDGVLAINDAERMPCVLQVCDVLQICRGVVAFVAVDVIDVHAARPVAQEFRSDQAMHFQGHFLALPVVQVNLSITAFVLSLKQNAHRL